MKQPALSSRRRWSGALAIGLAPLLWAAAASSAAPAPPVPGVPAPSAVPPVTASAASAPLNLKPPKRLLSTAEKLDAATAPGTIRPERKVVPQISIPLGRRSGDDASPRVTVPRRADASASAASAPIDDAAARALSRR